MLGADQKGESELFNSTGAILALHWGTLHRAIRTEDAAIAWFRAEQRLTTNAFVEELASWLQAKLLLYPQNRVLCRLGDSEFDDGLGWNLYLLLCLWIEADASLPFLLYELAKSRQDEFSILFDRFVGQVAERIEEYSSGSFVGLGGSSECDFKFGLGHV